MKKINWGILGPGVIAHQFAKDARHVESAFVSAVASRSIERARAFASEYKIPKVHNTYKELFEDPDIDAIYVATPHNFHLEQSAEALKNGKAVLCEKPLTESLGTSKELIKIAQEEKVYLMEGMWTYFLPAIRKAKQWVQSGRIGDILHLRSSFGYPIPYNAESRQYNPELAGGCLLDMGVYNVAMAELFICEMPRKASSRVHRATNGVEDDILSHVEYEHISAVLHSAFRCKLHNHLYIIGETGYIELNDFWRAKECKLFVGDELVDSFNDQRKGGGFEFQIASANEDISNGSQESEVVPHEASLRIQTLMATLLDPQNQS